MTTQLSPRSRYSPEVEVYITLPCSIPSLSIKCNLYKARNEEKKNCWKSWQLLNVLWTFKSTSINKGFTWFTDLAHSNKEVSTQKISNNYPPSPPHPQPLSKNQTKKFFKQKNFHICLNQPISYPKKKYLILTRKSRVVKTLLCRCVLNSAVYLLQTYKRVLIKINSHSLFGTAVIFSSIFFTQLAFVLYLQKDFYIASTIFSIFAFFFFRKISIPFTRLFFKSFFVLK